MARGSAGDPGSDEASELGYEEARAALAQVVATLEAGNVSLEDALELWERGERYAAQCQRWLDGAQARLDDGADAVEDPADDA